MQKIADKHEGDMKKWREAEEHGMDMSLLESMLRRTPASRMRAHDAALTAALELRKGMARRQAKSQHGSDRLDG